MELMNKDLRMAHALADDMEIDAPGLAACAGLYARAVAELGGKADHTEVMKVIEGA
jgi:3-hydroxyisobutyrate dehydrogenase-like beta-hydroxyacid dehydrogenase